MGLFGGFLGGLFGDDGSKELKSQQRQAEISEERRQRLIREGVAGVRGEFDRVYTDRFYNNLRQNYLNFMMPQLETQKQDAQRALIYDLSRRGLRRSSARAQMQGTLDDRYTINRLDLANRAQREVDQRRIQVANALDNASASINAATDPSAAAATARANAALNSFEGEYQPLGQVFQDLTATYALNRQLTDQGYPGLFGNNRSGSTGGAKSSGRVVR